MSKIIQGDVDDQQEVDSLMASSLEEGNENIKGSTFLTTEKNHIYNSRDFSVKSLSKKQKILLLIGAVLLFFLFKAVAIDPFHTDKEKWERTKEIVDKAIEDEMEIEVDAGEIPVLNETAMIQLEKAAEDFVKEEEEGV